MCEKPADEGNTAPEDVMEGVRRWMGHLERASWRDRGGWDRHPDWPSVVRWVTEFPDGRKVVRDYQENILRMRNVMLHSPAETATAFRLIRFFARFSGSRARKIAKPPGYLLLRISHFLLKPDAYTRYIVPFVADIQHEYFEAWKSGQHWRARWAVLRGYLHIVWPLVAGIAATIRAFMKLKGA